MSQMQTRRRFLTTLSLAGASGILSPRRAWAAEPPLETTTVRFSKFPVICHAQQYVCDALLRAEGFTDVGYVDTTVPTILEDLGNAKFDFASHLSLAHIGAIDRGLPITIVTGLHVGCYELFAHAGIRGITDLKGRRVGQLGAPELISMMAAYVGLDPKKDLTLTTDPRPNPFREIVELREEKTQKPHSFLG